MYHARRDMYHVICEMYHARREMYESDYPVEYVVDGHPQPFHTPPTAHYVTCKMWSMIIRSLSTHYLLLTTLPVRCGR